MSKHTPGPWRLTLDIDEESGQSYMMLEAGVGFCSPGERGFHVSGFVKHDDARLIAAAPDLLEACKAALDMVETDHGPPDWDLLRAAIAKAEGR